MKKRILVVAAHPDDEVLGCGGTIAKYSKEGSKIYTLILGEGITSRDEARIREEREGIIKTLKADARKANSIIGVEDIFIHDLPDNRFDTVALLDCVKIIEKIKDKVRPEVIYTHHGGDLNIDHRITYNAVLTACRPTKDEMVKEIYSFEVPSSTEWTYPCTFNPNIFIDISETIDKKVEALKIYKTELRDFPHPRSEEAVRAIATRWGSISGLRAAEAFEAIRIVR